MGKINIKNRTIFCRDNLEVLRGINSESVGLIYLDPPFNKKKTFIAPIGSQAEGASFKDIFRRDDVKEEWLYLLKSQYKPVRDFIMGVRSGSSSPYNWCYLAYMAARLIECHRVLRPTGSLYLHCDPTMSHYLKILLDCIFGEANFRNEIVWRIGWVSGFKTQKQGWIRNHETLLYYLKTPPAAKLFNKEYLPYPADYVRRDGKRPTGQGFPIEDTWNCHSGDVLDSIQIKSFSKEKTGYPTQKPLALLERIIEASSNIGDVVLDPFCGCATTCVAAENLQRQWIGIDVSPKAFTLVKDRLMQKRQLEMGSDAWVIDEIHQRKGIPQRTDIETAKLPKYNCLDNKRLLYKQQSGRCAMCGDKFEARHLEVDHFWPKARGGSDHISNLQLLCGHCNRLKGAGSMEAAVVKLNKIKAGELVEA